MIDDDIKKEKYEKEKDLVEERNDRPKFNNNKNEWEKKYDKYIPEING